MAQFQGQLRSNTIFSAIYNMIISQQVFADNVKGVFSELVDSARVDGGLLGDTKLYYATDVLKSSEWGNDAEASNLLALERPAAPKCQAIYIDQFRQIALTVDNYLSKQAWADEAAFGQFTSVMLGWIGETKRIYDATLYNTYIGTHVCDSTVNTINVDASEYPSLGQGIGEVIADLMVSLKDISRDYNEYGYLRSYDDSDIKIVWNSKYVNAVKKIDLPTLFHNEGLIEKFSENILPARYFGRAIVAASDIGSGKVIGITGEVDATKGTVRSRIEKTFTFEGNTVHLFPGDALKTGMKVDYEGGSVSNPDFDESEVYVEEADIICKVMHKDAVPYMSAFEVGTSFFNPKSLTENHYLTWGHNTLEYLKDKPLLVVKKV